ncbi:MAG TPA: hypothetical protein VFA78_06690, partial [Chloroflexota bacterium]|nr:hypothetical protein [Chloroflexota bacterium]
MNPDDLFRLRLVGDAQVAPGGKRIAYVVKNLDRESDEYISNIYLWDGTASRQFTAGGKDTAPRWSPDGSRLAFLRREDKNQIFLMPVSGGEATRLTDLPLGAGTPVWSPDGSSIAFSHPVATVEIDEDKPRIRVIERARYKQDGTGPVDHRRLQISIADLGGETRQLTSGDFDHAEPIWSPDGRHLAFAADRNPEWDLRMASDIWLIPREGGEPRRVTDGEGEWTSPTFSPDGSRLAFVGHAATADERPFPYTQLWTADRAGGNLRNLLAGTDLAVGDTLAGDWSIAGPGNPVWREDGIYFLASTCGMTNLYRWDEGTHPVTTGRQHVMDFSIANGTIVCTVSRATQPAEVGVVRDGTIEPVTCHNKDFAQDLVAPRELRFPGADGSEVEGWLMEPANRQPGRRYPLIVYIHGGPFSAYGETFFHEFQTLA